MGSYTANPIATQSENTIFALSVNIQVGPGDPPIIFVLLSVGAERFRP
jgi:hypothetical protein